MKIIENSSKIINIFSYNSKNFVFVVLIALSLIISACSEDTNKYERYTNTYYQVLIAREIFTDSTVANKEIRKVLAENGYTDKQFAEETYRIFQEDQKTLTTIIDSLRKRVIRDTDSLQKEKMKEMFKKSADSANKANRNN